MPEEPSRFVVWLCRGTQVVCVAVLLAAMAYSGEALVGISALAGAVFCAAGYLPEDIREGRG
jgi:hypothetical protein